MTFLMVGLMDLGWGEAGRLGWGGGFIYIYILRSRILFSLHSIVSLGAGLVSPAPRGGEGFPQNRYSEGS